MDSRNFLIIVSSQFRESNLTQHFATNLGKVNETNLIIISILLDYCKLFIRAQTAVVVNAPILTLFSKTKLEVVGSSPTCRGFFRNFVGKMLFLLLHRRVFVFATHV